MKDTNIKAIINLLVAAKIPYTSSPTGNSIVFGKKKIKINHNSRYHWTIRIPCVVAEGVRFPFNTRLEIANDLFIIEDTLAIRYD